MDEPGPAEDGTPTGERGRGSADDGSWDPEAYDGAHGFVHEHGAEVVDLLDPEAGESILDLGCGTGHLTARIAGTGADGVGMDRSAAMLATAREAYPSLPFIRADARAFPFEAVFDAVFSNAALHWIPAADHDAVLGAVRDALVPGGRFVAELGGTGNVAAIVGAAGAVLAERGYEATVPWYFPSVGEYASRLESHGFEVRDATLFDRPTDLDGDDGLREWLRTFGEGMLAPVPTAEREAVVSAIEDRLRPGRFRDGAWIADYRRLRFVAVRE